MLLLTKLDWDMSAVIAFDFVEHFIQRVTRMHLQSIAGVSHELIRSHSETLITMCAANDVFCMESASLVAASCILTALRPWLEGGASSNAIGTGRDISALMGSTTVLDTPSPSSCSSGGSLDKVSDMELVLDVLETMTLVKKVRTPTELSRKHSLILSSLLQGVVFANIFTQEK